ncbi:hypothetical protein CYMTET_15611 [Cymbomonas tetramitiformis]|uniref:Zinc finger PHD-type domain-containing protein n=1 Tax=Cymbomonas tetramitiformis TaxID=36881 RepID=A0AAE0L943_9CHLO|nr:hypothetical protein CYMTET_15611 [Cymbomonas tetramitiformis]
MNLGSSQEDLAVGAVEAITIRNAGAGNVLEGELYLITVNAKEVRVPKPEDRLDLVREYHEGNAQDIGAASARSTCCARNTGGAESGERFATSPEGNGLTERVVCTIKFCLKKCAFGLKEKTTASHIAPCFLQIKDEYDFQEAVPGKHHACHVCKRSDNGSKMLLCDRCNKGYHLWCLQPELKKVYQMVNGMAHAVKTRQKQQRVKRRLSEAESTDATEMERWARKLKRATSALLEKTPSPTTVLEFDVGPRRVILKGWL